MKYYLCSTLESYETFCLVKVADLSVVVWLCSPLFPRLKSLIYEHSEQARAPHTNGPRDVPRCGALSSSSKDAALQRGMMVVLMPLFAAALVARRRYFIVAPRPFPAAPLIVHHRCFIVVPMPMPEAPRMHLIVMYRPFPAAPLVVHCMYMAVVPNACGRSSAVLLTQLSTVGLRLRHKISEW